MNAAHVPGSFEELLREQLPALTAFVRLRMGARLRLKESASDLVQSSCRELLRHRRELDGKSSAAIKRWLYTAAEHKIQERLRYWTMARRDPQREHDSLSRESGDSARVLEFYRTFCTPSRLLSQREMLEQIETAFDRLPPDYREVILLAHIEQLSRDEIAQRLNRSEKAVRNLLCRAIARLSTLVEPEEK